MGVPIQRLGLARREGAVSDGWRMGSRKEQFRFGRSFAGTPGEREYV